MGNFWEVPKVGRVGRDQETPAKNSKWLCLLFIFVLPRLDPLPLQLSQEWGQLTGPQPRQTTGRQQSHPEGAMSLGKSP